jgi:hypothetical protein
MSTSFRVGRRSGRGSQRVAVNPIRLAEPSFRSPTAVFAVVYVVEGRVWRSAEPVRFVRRLMEDCVNSFHIERSAPLKQNALMKLPIGSIRPEGWLRYELQLEADGFTGHLTEVSKFCKFQGSAWTNPSGEGARLIGRKCLIGSRVFCRSGYVWG